MKLEKRLFAAVFALLLFFPVAGLAALSGSLDKRFDGDGKILIPGTTVSIIYDVAVQPDGKIVAVGWMDDDFLVVRLNPDGSYDTTFDGDGKVLTDFGGGVDTAYAVKIQPNGRILVAGSASVSGTGMDFAIARYTPAGALDTNFDTDGKVTTDFGQRTIEAAYEILVQSDSKYVVAGRALGTTTDVDYAAARYNLDGTLDTSFDTDGKVTVAVTNGVDTLNAAAIQANDRIILAGSSNGDFCLVRLLGTGALDTNFDTDGIVTTDFNGSDDVANAITIQPDGRSVVCGAAGQSATERDFGCARYNTNGALNLSFDTDGKATASVSTGTNDQAYDIAVQPDGKLVVAGAAAPVGGLDAAVVRFNSDGSLDTSFDTDGKVSADINVGSADIGRAVALQADGRIVVGGSASSGIVRAALLRFNPHVVNTPFDFDGDDKTDVGIFRPSVGEWWYSRSSNNQVLAAQFGASTDKITPGDYTGDGKSDIAFFRPASGFWYVLRSEDGSFFSFPFGASGDVPAPADYDGDGKTDPAVYRASAGTWYISRSSDNATSIVGFGSSEDKPVAADYDGDGKADVAIFRPSDGSWWYLRSSDGDFRVYRFGVGTDKPVQGDYTGDGKADIAVFRPSTGVWYVQRSEDGSYFSFPFGAAGDTAVAADYDGDGKTDSAVFRAAASTWYLNQTTAGVSIVSFGASTDTAIPTAFVP
ncbi:MAG: VCBS repeat-containing protein [Acidobacteria bacterium]|nr:VCBS repeat-containing protein [Acidobacteriota bacterium]